MGPAVSPMASPMDVETVSMQAPPAFVAWMAVQLMTVAQWYGDPAPAGHNPQCDQCTLWANLWHMMAVLSLGGVLLDCWAYRAMPGGLVHAWHRDRSSQPHHPFMSRICLVIRGGALMFFRPFGPRSPGKPVPGETSILMESGWMYGWSRDMLRERASHASGVVLQTAYRVWFEFSCDAVEAMSRLWSAMSHCPTAPIPAVVAVEARFDSDDTPDHVEEGHPLFQHEAQRASISRGVKRSWDELSEEQRKERGDAIKRSWDGLSEEQKKERGDLVSAGLQRSWDGLSEEQRKERGDAIKRSWDELSEEQRKERADAIRDRKTEIQIQEESKKKRESRNTYVATQRELGPCSPKTNLPLKKEFQPGDPTPSPPATKYRNVSMQQSVPYQAGRSNQRSAGRTKETVGTPQEGGITVTSCLFQAKPGGGKHQIQYTMHVPAEDARGAARRCLLACAAKLETVTGKPYLTCRDAASSSTGDIAGS